MANSALLPQHEECQSLCVAWRKHIAPLRHSLFLRTFDFRAISHMFEQCRILFLLGPYGSPVNISLVEATSHSLTITWMTPVLEVQNGPIVGYIVRYWEEGWASLEPAAVDDLRANQSSGEV